MVDPRRKENSASTRMRSEVFAPSVGAGWALPHAGRLACGSVSGRVSRGGARANALMSRWSPVLRERWGLKTEGVGCGPASGC